MNAVEAKKVVIFGNSGAGKSTLAKQMSEDYALAHFDLDTVAWLPTTPPQRKPIAESLQDITAFTDGNEAWVIEGCYADLLAEVISRANEIVFLDLPISQCIENARKRPWEPHKYASKQEQDANLEMLIDWISQYTERDDTFSRRAHEGLYEAFSGQKRRHTANI